MSSQVNIFLKTITISIPLECVVRKSVATFPIFEKRPSCTRYNGSVAMCHKCSHNTSFFFLLVNWSHSINFERAIHFCFTRSTIAYESFTTKRRMDLSYLSIDRLHESRLSTQPLKVYCSQSDRYARVIFISNRILSQPQLLK